MRFIPQARDGKRHVTDTKLAKTRKFMGQHAHAWCQRNNVSTGWTDIDIGTSLPQALPDWPEYNSQPPLSRSPASAGLL